MGDKSNILRRGRFEGNQDPEISRFLSSINQDLEIMEADLWVGKAHAIMLQKQGIISGAHCTAILKAIDSIARQGREGLLGSGAEDVHVFIETEIIEQLGEEVGGRLHTARSRNDEVSTCLRIALRDRILTAVDLTTDLVDTLLRTGSNHLSTLMPGFTHLQHAQPTTLAHHLLSHAVAFHRDIDRLRSCYRRVNISPLGAGAMASTSHPIDPHLTARLLGFDGVALNSMDAVSSRDFLLETLCCLSVLGVTVSRLAEEIILWNTAEFGFVTLPDEHSSTSSIMPQKRNPDAVEITRARVSTVIGSLSSALSILKSLPQSYNRDLQEANKHLWAATEATNSILSVMGDVMGKITYHKGRMSEAANIGCPWATDLADELVRRFGLPFRTAHTVVAKVVKEWGGKSTGKISDLLRVASMDSGWEVVMQPGEIEEITDIGRSIERRKISGGPSAESVSASIRRLRDALDDDRRWLEDERQSIADARKRTEEMQRELESRES